MALAIQMGERDTCELLCLDLSKAEALRAALTDLGAALAAVYRGLQRVAA